MFIQRFLGLVLVKSDNTCYITGLWWQFGWL